MAKQKGQQPAILPPGFKATRRGNFPPVHDFTKTDTLQGAMVEIRDVPKGKNIIKPTRIMTVADKKTGEMVSVWESAALKEMFDEAKKGNGIFIHYNGPVKVKGRKQPMKGFTAGISAKA